MLKHWQKIVLAAGLVVLGILIGLVYPRRGVRAPTVAMQDVPAAAQETVLAALAQKGFPARTVLWTGDGHAWGAPATYRVFFESPGAEGHADIYWADVQLDAAGRVTRLARINPLTETPAGDESALALSDAWLAYGTRVMGLYQSITCVPLDALDQRHVFVLQRPCQELRLTWRAESGPPPTLEVVIPQTGNAYRIEPVARRVLPEGAGLDYTPAQEGEFSWLPSFVSRVRKLPFVGAEKIAFLENVFFTAVDYVMRWWHGLRAPRMAQDPPAPTPTEAPRPEPTATPSPTAPPTLTPLPSATALPTFSATATRALPSATPTLTPTPSPTATPTATATPTGKRLAEGILWRDTLKPDSQRPYAFAEVIELDPALLQIKMICGTAEPQSTTGLVGSGVIPREDWPHLVAAFNGGFAAMHGYYGMMVDRKVYLPARNGIATLAVYEDGSIRMGTWGQDITLTPDMVSYRQNCLPLIENGTITAETGKLALWGLSVSNQVYLYRSGLGITKEGRLIYVVGKPLSAYTLARALQMAGAVYAMQLDVDEYHVVFITYDVQPGKEGGQPVVTGRKLRNDMHGYDGYFLRPFQLDFFYLTRRPQPLAQPVRLVATAPIAARTSPLQEVMPTSQALPGQIAFASNRTGNWELYAMRPGDPASVRRLTEHPAEDLHPAWSSDGQRLAFTSRRDGNAEVYILNLSDGALQRVTHHLSSDEWAPCWSPDGTRLVYQSDRNGQSDIYICAPDGSGEKRLTPYEGNHESPHFSPDGKLLVFDSDLDVGQPVHASINLYLMQADGANPRRMFSGGESPTFSPDGRSVAFTSQRGKRWQIYVVGIDGAGLRQITDGSYDARYPTWSPDGQWIAFAGNQVGFWNLYAIPAKGGQPIRLTFDMGDCSYPAWGP